MTIFGCNMATCNVSLRFFSPPEKSTLSARSSSAASRPIRCCLGTETIVETRRVDASSRESVMHHIDELNAGNLGRVLHHEVQAGLGPLPTGQRQHVDAVEQHRTGDHLVAGLAHDDGRQRALAGTVRAHDGVHLARSNRQGDAVEDGLAGHRGDQVANFEGAH